jgi:hypothetical protein
LKELENPKMKRGDTPIVFGQAFDLRQEGAKRLHRY